MPKSCYSLVPVRDHQQFTKKERLALYPGQVLGRGSLLRTFNESCGCCWKCPTCRALFSWATQFVSREALRCIAFEENDNIATKNESETKLCLQFKGQNTKDLLYVNNEKLDTDNRQSSILMAIQQQQEWMGAIPLRAGTRIAFRKAENGKQNNSSECEEVAYPPLEFQVSVEQCQSVTEEIFLTSQSLEEGGNDAVETNDKSYPTQSSPRFTEPVNSNSPNNNSTPNMLTRLERRIEQDALTWKPLGMTSKEKDRLENIKKMLPKQEEAVISSATKKQLFSNQNYPTSKKLPLQHKRTHNTNEHNKTILFVPLGRSLTTGRIQTLKSVVQRKGWKVVSELDSSPSHIVVDMRVGVQPLARALGFRSNTRLANVIQEKCITLVKPSWITNNKGNDLKYPKLSELYNGLVSESEPVKKRRISVVHNAKSNHSEDEYITEVPATGEKKVRNLEISKILERLARAYQKAPIPGSVDEFRAYTFHLVAGRLRCLDFDLINDPAALEKLKSISGIGESSREVIREWLRTRQLPKRIKLLEKEERRVAMCNLQKIWGIGPTTAQRLYMLDFTNINQIRKALREEKLQRLEKAEKSSAFMLSSFLTRNQFVGIECYEEFQEKMSRSEVEEIFQICRNELLKLLPNAIMEIMGSYRRGKQVCGDADFLIVDPDWNNCTPKLALGKLVTCLHRKGHIAYHLTETPGIVKIEDIIIVDDSKGENSQSSAGSDITTIDKQQQPHRSFERYPTSQTYMGVFCSPTVPGKRRRIDIKFYPYRERAYATLYFTGCGWFNRSMRLWSKRKFNLRLNDHGLFPHDGKPTEHKPKPLEDLPFPSLNAELNIFEKLDLVFKEPFQRNCFDDVVSKSGGETVAQLPMDDQQEYREEQKWRRYITQESEESCEWFNRDFFGEE